MSYVNKYTPQPGPTVADSELYGPDPYDINFAFPLHQETLQTSRLKLVPFIPSLHAGTYWNHVKDRRDELLRYYTVYFHTPAEFLAWHELTFRRNPLWIYLAIIDKTRPDPAHPDWGGSLAGTVGLINGSAKNLQMEPGYIMVFPEFQHTHVAKEMVAICLNYILQLPSASPPGLGFRRAQWCANPQNAPSIGLAERMGFKREGTLRYTVVLPKELAQYGRQGRAGDAFEKLSSRDTAVLALCCDDWENGAREKVQAFIQ
ncbi:acyl-CoA N-acyltransferase [Pilatotrama ljubarskyi]|nr:acyl-CoA N-acyltransferase [Pilatotrama ljubarskyi]